MLLQPGLQQFGNEITRSRNVRFSQGGGRLSNIGIKGRRTGLQARDVNKDSDGFANVDEFFDSPITTATAPSNIFGKSSLLDGAFDDDIDDDSNNNTNNNDNNNDSNDIHSESSVSSDAELTLTTNNEKNLNIHSNDTINHNNDEAAVRATRRKSVSYADSPSNTMPASGGFDDDRYAPLSSDDESEQAYDVVRRASATKARRGRRRRDDHVDHSPPPFAGELQQTPRGSAVWSGTDGRLCLTPVLVRAKFLPSVANIARPVDGVFRAVRRKLIRKIYVPPPPRDRDARSRRRRRHHGRHRRRREHEASPRASIAKPQQRSAKKLPPKTPITVAGERVQFDDLDDGVQVGPLFDAPSGLFAARVMTLHANAVYSLGGSKAAHTLYVAKGSVTLQFDGDSTLLTHAAGTSFVIRPKQRATLRTHPTCSLARLNHYAIAADAFLGDEHSDDDY